MTGERKTELDKDALEKACQAYEASPCMDLMGPMEAAILAYEEEKRRALPQSALSSRLVEWAEAFDERANMGLTVERLALLNGETPSALLREAAAALGGIPEGWRTIDSAPKDGTRMLLAKIVGHPDHPTALWWATVGMWSAKWNNWNDGIEPCGLADPSHWMPISARGVGAAAAPPLTPGEQK